MKKKDIFIQESASSCGACVIASIVSFYGGYVPLDIILEDTETDLNGTNALKLKNTLENYGFKANGIKTSIESLKKDILTLPTIAHIKREGLEHFVLIYEINENSVVCMDPAVGEIVYDLNHFKDISTGYFITATPDKEIPKYENSTSLLQLLIPLLKEKSLKVFTIVMISILSLAISVFTSFHLKLLDLSVHKFILSTLFIFLELLIGVLEYLKYKSLTNLEKYIDDKSLISFTSHIFRLPLKILKNRRVGEIIQKIENMTFVKNLFLKLSIELPLDFLSLAVALLAINMISKRLLLLHMIVIFVYATTCVLTKDTIYKDEKELNHKETDYKGMLVEYLGGIESIKNLNGEERFLDELDNTLETFTLKREEKMNKRLKISVLKSEIFKIGSIITNLVGYMSICEGFTFIDLLTITNISQILYSSFSNILNTLEDWTKFRALLKSISEFYDLKTEPNGKEGIGPLKTLNIENLSYSYNHLDYTIKDFSYKLNVGEDVLIKGPSGIGKSTLVKCISGFDRNYTGTIAINGMPINDIGVKYIKENILYVGREESLFTMSICDNITLKDYDRQLFQKVAKITKVDEIISAKREGQNTMLQEGASNLSGGERARVILARALYRKPKVLIIDETLSAVSEKQENEIIKNILSLKNISLIYITHRNKDSLFKNIIEFRKEGKYDITRKRTIKH